VRNALLIRSRRETPALLAYRFRGCRILKPWDGEEFSGLPTRKRSDHNQGGQAGARCVARTPADPKGKDIEMSRLHGKSPFYRISILLWPSAILAGLMLGALCTVAQTGGASSPSGGVTRREAADAIVAQEQSEIGTNAGSSQGSISARQKRLLLKDNLEKMKRDAGELADLTKALQDELNKSNENTLPLGVVAKADKIQKLAKKIKANARGI